MPLITVVITLLIAGVLLWLINTYIPMDGKIKKILNLVVVIVVARVRVSWLEPPMPARKTMPPMETGSRWLRAGAESCDMVPTLKR